MSRPVVRLAAYLSALVAIGLVGLWIAGSKHGHAGAGAVSNTADSVQSGTKPLYWYDPMHPNEHFDKPGKSPFMDMQLVPRRAGEESSTPIPGSVEVDPRVVQNLGVRLAAVERGRLARLVDSVGMVSVDEHRIQAVQVRASGWVEQLAVRAASRSPASSEPTAMSSSSCATRRSGE